jgi:hypothetical protein
MFHVRIVHNPEKYGWAAKGTQELGLIGCSFLVFWLRLVDGVHCLCDRYRGRLPSHEGL